MFGEETIAAVATAYGEGGIGIIRISGEKAKEILDRIFVTRGGAALQNRRLTYGIIKDPASDAIVDEVLVVFMQAPNTYTREDIAEIHCHGSIVSLRKTLELVLRYGAQPAQPGEFTKRAFLNGRLDLTQAEAVIDLIRAKTDKGFDVAIGQLEGMLSENVKEIRNILMDLLVKITVNLDYPDEDIEEITYQKLKQSILQINDMVEKLLSTANTGRIIREGLKVVISGSPNVGKSSLLNALLKESRAIVTEIPGTTRDTIEEMMSIRGIPIKLVDTAGIRHTDDVIEKIGIEKSKQVFNEADLILFMIDGSKELSSEDLELLAYIGNRKAIVLINKIDIGKKINEHQILDMFSNYEIIDTSVIDDIGIDELEDKIETMVYDGKLKQSEGLLITNARHKNLLVQAAGALKDALEMTEKREALDFIEVDIRRCWSLLGEIIGETVTEDIINEVFANFCLGK